MVRRWGGGGGGVSVRGVGGCVVGGVVGGRRGEGVSG